MEAANATTSTTGTATAAPNVDSFTPSNAPHDIKVSPNGSSSGEWTSALNEELKGYVQTKGFKDPASVVDSYRGLEKLLGSKDKLLKLPEKEDAPEWGEIYNKLGRPASPKDYKFEMPKDTDPAFENWARESFHKLGLTQKQGETLLKEYSALNAVKASEFNDQHQAQLQAQEAGLKKEWGAAFDQNIQVARKAAAQFGFDDKAIDNLEASLGYDGVMKFLHNVGSKIGESPFAGPNTSQGFGGVMTPEQARFEIKELQKDNIFISKWKSGDRESKARFDQLHKWAYPE